MPGERTTRNTRNADPAMSDIERIFGRSGTLPRAAHPNQGKKLSNQKTAAKVEVKKGPRLSPEQIRQLQREEREKKIREEKREAARRLREEHRVAEVALRRQRGIEILQSPSWSLKDRLEAARSLGFTVAYRGPADKPRRIVFRGAEDTIRVSVTMPKGKNAYARFIARNFPAHARLTDVLRLGGPATFAS